MIDTARLMIAAAEDTVLGSPTTAKPSLNRLIRTVIAPWLLLARGLKDMWVQLSRAIFVAVLGGIVGLMLPHAAQASRTSTSWFLAMAAASVALLSSPSDLCRSIDEPAIKAVVRRLREQGVGSQMQIDGLVAAVTLLERRPNARIAALKWILAGAWAAAVYSFSQGLASSANAAATQAYIQLASSALLVAGLLYALVRAYASPTELVFEAVYLGLAQHRYELDSESKESDPSGHVTCGSPRGAMAIEPV